MVLGEDMEDALVLWEDLGVDSEEEGEEEEIEDLYMIEERWILNFWINK